MLDRGSLTVLLIENNPGDARLIEEMLRDMPGRFPTAGGEHTGGAGTSQATGSPTLLHADRLSAGLEQLDETSVDLVLLDLGLSDSTGLDTLTTVLEHPATVPVVVLTGLVDEAVGVQAVQQGAQSYLLKDEITSELLIRSLHHALERHQRELQLTALTRVSRELMAATTDDDIAARTVTAAAEFLGFPVAVVCLYDADRGELRPHAATEQAGDLLLAEGATSDTARSDSAGSDSAGSDSAGSDTAGSDTARSDRAGIATQLPTDYADLVGRVFATNQAVIETGDERGSDHSDDLLRSRIVLPITSHGVFLAGSATATTVPSTAVEYVNVLVTNAEAALVRLEREQELHEREAALEIQTETLERLERMNAVIRDIVQGVVHARTRTEIEHTVCERLATAGPFRFVWIGEHDPLTGTLTARAHAGIEEGYLERGALADDEPAGPGPVATAIRTRELQVVEDVVRDLPPGPKREAALQRGYRAVASIPLVYSDTLYGVLTVYADRLGIFTAQERVVLRELGETIAHAINAVESKRALISDRVVELEFQVRDTDLVLVNLSARVGCAVTFESVIPRLDDRLRAYFSTRGASVGDVIEFAEQTLAFEDVALVTEKSDECVFECTLREPNLLSFCLEYGVTVQSLTADRGEGSVIVELASDAGVREFAAQFQARYPETVLVASREAERSVQTRQAFQSTLDERLTARQAEVLRTAFFSGYFDSPRTSSGRDVAATLDIAQPTFNTHLRAALRKLLTMLYTE